jgi:hypothetical protein
VAPLLAVVVLAVGGLTFGLARFGVTVAESARAQAAADGAALAGAAAGRDAAQAVTGANGAELSSYDALGDEVEVRARVGRSEAVARAQRRGGGDAVRGWVGDEAIGGSAGELDPAVRSALSRAAALLDQPVPFLSATGTSVDVPASFAGRLARVAADAGLCRRWYRPDPVRFDLCQPTRG